MGPAESELYYRLAKGVLLEFLRDGSMRSNAWLEVGPLDVYVRKGWMVIPWPRKLVPVFTISNVKIDKEELRGKGHFKCLLRVLRELLSTPEFEKSFVAIHVELVSNRRLEYFLVREGFRVRDGGGEDPVPSFFLRLDRPPSQAVILERPA